MPQRKINQVAQHRCMRMCTLRGSVRFLQICASWYYGLRTMGADTVPIQKEQSTRMLFNAAIGQTATVNFNTSFTFESVRFPWGVQSLRETNHQKACLQRKHQAAQDSSSLVSCVHKGTTWQVSQNQAHLGLLIFRIPCWALERIDPE